MPSWCLVVLSLPKSLSYRSQKADAVLCPFGTPRNAFSFHHQGKIMDRNEGNTQRDKHLAALSMALYPLVLGLLKPTFPAHYHWAHAAAEMKGPSEACCWGVFGVRVDAQKRAMSGYLFCMRNCDTSKLTVNPRLHNECFYVQMLSWHEKGCGACPCRLGTPLGRWNGWTRWYTH